MSDIDSTIEQRGNRYGPYEDTARVAQCIKRAMASGPNWDTLSDIQRESLEMVATKISRILSGDCDWPDSWLDIGGYATLAANEINSMESPSEHA